MKYRKDVDGLRAIAIGSVVLFHYDVPLFTGGFTGVDVFFVISGFLISTILLDSLEQGRFSLVDFYERRARRILPALFALLPVTLLWACLVLYPHEVRSVARSTLATLGFYANFYYSRRSGYFQGGSDYEPLLHMWTLAVEEQFYIFFPVLLYLGYRHASRRMFVGIFYAGFLCSLALSIYGVTFRPTYAFYWPVTRAWELMLGTVIARPAMFLPVLDRINRPLTASVAAFVGIACVLLPVFLLDSGDVFPGVNAIPTALGSAMLIWSASRHETAVSRILGSRPFVFVGLISYSLYLWHWPIWVLSAETSPGLHDSPLAVTVLAGFSVLLAWLSWRYVEAPFRSRKAYGRRAVFTLSGIGGLAITVCASVAVVAPASVARVQIDGVAAHLLDFRSYRDNVVFPHAPCFIGRKEELIDACPKGKARSEDVVIWGDSFAEHLIPGLLANESKLPGALIQITSGGCPPFVYTERGWIAGREPCREYSAKATNWLARLAPGTVVISAQWNLHASGRWGFDLDKELECSIGYLRSIVVQHI
jgi:peptidoglycan/LPS O-acetylase OafA/YrhL